MAASRRLGLALALSGLSAIGPRAAQAACSWLNPPACTIVKNVAQVPASGCTADAATIQNGIGLLPKTIPATTNECAVIRDTQTYNESVTFQGFTFSDSNSQVELLLDPSLSSGPVVTSSFTIANASVTIGGGILIQPTSRVLNGIAVSAANVTISSVAVVDTVTCFVGVPNQPCIGSAGIVLASNDVVSYSTVTVVSNGVYLNGVGNAITGSSLSSIYFDNAAQLNTVSISTVASTSASAVVTFNGASMNTITQSYVGNSGTGDGIDFSQAVSPAAYNMVSYSTVVAGASGSTAAVYLNSSSSNTIVNSYIFSPSNTGVEVKKGINNQISQSTVIGAGVANYGVRLDIGSSNNTISQSVLSQVGGAGGAAALGINNASLNTVTGCSLNGADGLYIQFASSSNTVSGCTMTGSVYGADLPGTGGGNVLANDFVYTNAGADAMFLAGNGYSVSGSTIVNASVSGNKHAVNITGNADAVTGCYLAASDPVNFNGASGAVVAGNAIVSTKAGENSVYATLSSGLSVISNAISGAGQAGAIFLDVGNLGTISLSSNTIKSGLQYGIFVATQSAGTAVWIASNTVYGTLAGAYSTYGIFLDGLATGATIYANGVYLRSPGGGAGSAYYGLYAQSSQGLSIQHNRINDPGMAIGGSSFIGMGLVATANTVFKFNDVASTGTALGSVFLVKAANNSTGLQVRDNVFLSSVAVTGSSATISVDAGSQPGFISDYNDWFSATPFNSFLWGGTAYQGLSAWKTSGNDTRSISVYPLWFNTSAGVEDFHPLSNSARCVAPPADYASPCASWAIDSAQSPTIDAADPAEPFSAEPSPNGGRANQGSTGNTPQASGSSVLTSVVAITPLSGATVSASTSVGVFFSKPMSTGTLSAVTITAVLDNQGNVINQLVAATTSYNQAVNELILVPSAPLSKNYTFAVQVPASVKDGGGNPLIATASSTFTTYFDHTVANAVSGAQGTLFTIPAGAFLSDGSVSAQAAMASPSIQTATQKLLARDNFANPISLLAFSANDASGNLMEPSLPVSVSIPFSSTVKPGFVDNTTPPVRVDMLALWWLDPATSSWVRVPSSSANAAASRLTATTTHFSTFGLIGAQDASLSTAFAFPVPYVPAKQITRVITFQNLSSTGRIRIFTVSGKLVREIDYNDGSGQATWDVKNSAGQDAASGLYIYLIESSGDTKKGELIIVR